MGSSIKVNVIKAQELGIGFATTRARAFAAAIPFESLNLKLQMLVFQLCLIVRETSFGLHPFHSSIMLRKSRKR
jgi:hypothetical protein